MMRLLTITVGLALVAAAAWYADGWMQGQAWARYDDAGAGWKLTASGWGLLLRAWPVALAGAGIGLALAWPAGIWTGSQASRLDLSERESALEAREAEKSAREVVSIEEANRHAVRASERTVAAERLMAEAQQRQAQAAEQLREAHALAAKAEARIANADRRRRNATGAAGRMRSKLQRLSESDALTDRPKSVLAPPATS